MNFEEFKDKIVGAGKDDSETTEIKARLAFALLESDGPVFEIVKSLSDRLTVLEAKHAAVVSATENAFKLVDQKLENLVERLNYRHGLVTELFVVAGLRFDSLEERLDDLEAALESDDVDGVADEPVGSVNAESGVTV